MVIFGIWFAQTLPDFYAEDEREREKINKINDKENINKIDIKYEIYSVND